MNSWAWIAIAAIILIQALTGAAISEGLRRDIQGLLLEVKVQLNSIPSTECKKHYSCCYPICDDIDGGANCATYPNRKGLPPAIRPWDVMPREYYMFRPSIEDLERQGLCV